MAILLNAQLHWAAFLEYDFLDQFCLLDTKMTFIFLQSRQDYFMDKTKFRYPHSNWGPLGWIKINLWFQFSAQDMLRYQTHLQSLKNGKSVVSYHFMRDILCEKNKQILQENNQNYIFKKWKKTYKNVMI